MNAPEWLIPGLFGAAAGAIALLDPKLGRFERNRAVRRNTTGQEDRSTDDGISTYAGVATENDRVGVNGDVVTDRGVALGLADDTASLVLGERQRAERDALIDLDVVAYVGGLADDHARAVVDEEVPPDARPGVNIDTRLEVRPLGHDA